MANQAEYRKLRRVWYKKLREETDFVDIESNDEQLKGGSSNWKFNSAWTTAYSQQSKADYYYMAYQFLNNAEFESKLDEAIWAYHAEAISVRKIASLLKDAGVTKFYRRSKRNRAMSPQKIWQIIKKYRDIMIKAIK